MAVFIDINHSCTTPCKQEVSEPSAADDSKTQPDIVRHEDEHQHVANCDLNDMKQSLNAVCQAHHMSTTAITSTV